jgi:hypothetical protein
MNLVCWLGFLNKILISFSSLVSGLCIIYHNFYCVFSCYLPSTKPGLRYLYSCVLRCGGGVEYLHLRVLEGDGKGSLQSETVKHGYESQGLGPKNDCAGEDQHQL